MLRGLALSHVVDSLHEGVAALDADGVVLGANEAFTRLVARSSGSRPSSTTSGARLPADQHPWAQVLRTGEPVHDRVVGLPAPPATRSAGCGSTWRRPSSTWALWPC